MNEIKIIKFIAPKTISINGHAAPCECTDMVTCPYCVQASLLSYEKKFQENDQNRKNIISHIKKNGIRKTAREMSTQVSSVQYWFKTENFPQWVLNKYAECTNDHSTLHTT